MDQCPYNEPTRESSPSWLGSHQLLSLQTNHESARMLNAKDVARRRLSKTEPGADRGRRNVVRRCVNTSLRKRGRGRGALTWGGRGSNPRPTDYESVPSAETGFDGVS